MQPSSNIQVSVRQRKNERNTMRTLKVTAEEQSKPRELQNVFIVTVKK
jgi:hypothetical protein